MTRFVFFETPRFVLQAAAPLYAELAALKMRVALARLALKYSPSQPRAPSGTPDGGQWTDAGGGGWTRIAGNGRAESGIATDAQVRNPKPEQNGNHVILPDGQLVANKHSKTEYLISPVSDLSPVADAERKAGALYQQMLSSPDPDVQQVALPQFISSIDAAIGHGGTFDYQRSRANFLAPFIQLPQFRDVSNFNVGVYMQQTGQFSEQDTLSLAGTFARYFSSNYTPNQPYGLDTRTASLIKIGYSACPASGLMRQNWGFS